MMRKSNAMHRPLFNQRLGLPASECIHVCECIYVCECTYSKKCALYSEERPLLLKERAIHFEETCIYPEAIQCDTQASFPVAAGAGGK